MSGRRQPAAWRSIVVLGAALSARRESLADRDGVQVQGAAAGMERLRRHLVPGVVLSREDALSARGSGHRLEAGLR